MQSQLLQELTFRGFIKDATHIDELDTYLFSGGKVAVYAGFDCTADSLHIGNMMSLQMLSIFQKHGHRILPLIGTATTLIGDPSGKNKTRPHMSVEKMQENKIGIMKSIDKFVNPTISNSTILENGDWIGKISWLDMLRLVGPHISVNKMLTLDSVKNRLENQESLSFLEFNYSIMQGYDFYHISQTLEEPLVQIGGSDQWGNIVMGVEMIGKLSDKRAFAVTHPLLLDENGNKMGKTADGNTIWLNEGKISDLEFYQFWRNTKDSDVERFLKIFTHMNENEITEALKNINLAKEILALTITATVRGKENAEKARLVARGELLVAERTFKACENWSKTLVAAGLAESLSDARRLMKAGGIKANGQTITEDGPLDNFYKNDKIFLIKGKKQAVNIEK